MTGQMQRKIWLSYYMGAFKRTPSRRPVTGTSGSAKVGHFFHHEGSGLIAHHAVASLPPAIMLVLPWQERLSALPSRVGIPASRPSTPTSP